MKALKELPPNCTIDRGKYVVWRKQKGDQNIRISLGLIDDGVDCIWSQYYKLIDNKNIVKPISNHYLYPTWMMMIERCENPKATSFENYGGRGIKVCKRWKNSFLCFYADMGDKPSKGHSIDRINNNGNYTPKNCRWATAKQQSMNKRTNVKKVDIMNKKFSYKGLRRTIRQWARMERIDPEMIKKKIECGCKISEILTNQTTN